MSHSTVPAVSLRWRSLQVAVLATSVVGMMAAPAAAQNPAPEPSPAAQQPAPAPPEQDVFDLARRLLGKPPDPAAVPGAIWDHKKPMLALLPTFGAKPSTGFSFGAAANLTVYFGEPATTPISSANVSGSFSTKKQTSVLARVAAAGSEDRRRLTADYRFQWTSQDTFGLGTNTAADDGVNARFTYIRLFQTAYVNVGKGIKGGVGVHYGVHSDIRPGEDAELTWEQSSLVEYSNAYGLELQEQTSAGFSLNLLRDTRDHQINASRGWFGSLSFRPYFKDVLGGDSVWQEVLVDLRTYTRVKGDGRHKLAFWLYGDFVTDGVAPYLDLPSIGADTYGRTGRGYEEGRFRGERMLYGEVEYRATLTANGLLGMVVFANTTTVSSLLEGQRIFDSFAPAGGVGLRVLFNKRAKTNLCIDYAFGESGSRGLYLALQEAF